jgi:hypothetical protein
MQKRVFPAFESHDEVLCYKCFMALVDQPPNPTTFSVGDGHWKKRCPRCDQATFYDLEMDIKYGSGNPWQVEIDRYRRALEFIRDGNFGGSGVQAFAQDILDGKEVEA